MDGVRRFKFKGGRGCARLFGQLMAQCLQDRWTGRVDLVTWAPLHPERKRRRGYDQAELLARRVGELTGTPVEGSVLYRARANVNPTTHSAPARRRAAAHSDRVAPLVATSSTSATRFPVRSSPGTDGVRDGVRRFKFKGGRGCARLFGQLMAQCLHPAKGTAASLLLLQQVNGAVLLFKLPDILVHQIQDLPAHGVCHNSEAAGGLSGGEKIL